jgi:arylsulfatase A-like enzyme
LWVLAGPGVPVGRRDGLRLLDVAPTALDLLGLPVPEGLQGQAVRPAAVG